MGVTGLANLAVKVADLEAASSWYTAAGATVTAIYEDACELPEEGFLHPALFVDDLDAELAHHRVLWGPRVVVGSFGVRRIAFVEAPGGIRLEFMEQVEEPEVPT